MNDKTREYIVALALKFQGTPYIWGGSVPYIGFDCSGFVIWVLQVFGILPPSDWTANGLSKLFPPTTTPKPGDLCFYGTESVINGTKATHVMMYMGNGMCVGASGGGSECTTVERARSKGAQVKVKPVKYRGDFLFYREIGNGNPNTNP